MFLDANRTNEAIDVNRWWSTWYCEDRTAIYNSVGGSVPGLTRYSQVTNSPNITVSVCNMSSSSSSIFDGKNFFKRPLIVRSAMYWQVERMRRDVIDRLNRSIKGKLVAMEHRTSLGTLWNKPSQDHGKAL